MLAAAAAAAPGDLDPGFAGDGRLTLERGSDSTAAVVRPGGGILLAGCAGRRDPRILMRISPGGEVLGKFGSAAGLGCAVDAAAAPRGRVLVVGFGPAGGCVAARLTSRGELDPSFSGDGLKPLRLPDGRSFGFCPALAADRAGRAVVLGDDGLLPGGAYHFALARLRADGSFDRAFSGDGRLVGRFRRGLRAASPRDVAIAPDGRVVVAGKARTFAVARYTAAGRPDRAFSFDGRRLIAPRAIGGANAVAVGPFGGIALAGEVFEGNSERSRRLAVFRLTGRGDLDFGFGDGGRFYGHVGQGVVHDTGAAVALDPGGNVLVAGATQREAEAPDFGVIRLTPEGALDQSFSGDGHLAVGFEGMDAGEGADFAERLATTAHGGIVVMGTSEPGLSIARLQGG